MQNNRMLLRSKEAAEILAISPRSLWTLHNTGNIPSVRIGSRVYYRPDDLQAWLDLLQEKHSKNRNSKS